VLKATILQDCVKTKPLVLPAVFSYWEDFTNRTTVLILSYFYRGQIVASSIMKKD